VESHCVVGVDVGGTNTDAVLMRGRDVLAARKSPTTPDVASGIVAAIGEVLHGVAKSTARVRAVMIGTTHFTNAFVEARNLTRVGVLRLAAPATLAIMPMMDWPARLRELVCGHIAVVPGGYNYDGRLIAPLDDAAVRSAAQAFAANGISSVAISSVFAPVNAEMERQAAELVREVLPGVAVTLSSDIGRIGLIERENAAIVNGALAPMAARVVASFCRSLLTLGLKVPLYISQNDGTLLDAETVARLPVLTFSSGPTNSMRGAARLSGARDAIVIDIGGTTSDVGALVNGFPRESAIAADVGGVRTNFRMPDVYSIGLGGGSLVEVRDGQVRVGPRSVGYRITDEALVFGGRTLTATDIAVAAGYAEIGDRDRVSDLDRSIVQAAVENMHRQWEDALDHVKTAAGDAPVVLVGGGSILVHRELRGAASVSLPKLANVANAVGAAIAQVGGSVDKVYSYEALGRQEALRRAREEASANAIGAGALPSTTQIVDLEELPLQYLPGGAVRVRAKAVGDLPLSEDAT
jgi:N-methylhydantoinase A/oxoprolinase/acetone carboxylase beta subunit